MRLWVRLWALAILVATATGFAVPVGPGTAHLTAEAPVEGADGEPSVGAESGPEWAPRRRTGSVGWAAPAAIQPPSTPRADTRVARPAAALTPPPRNRLALLQRLNC